MERRATRRRLLAGLGASVSIVGCLGDGSSDDGSDGGPADATDDGSDNDEGDGAGNGPGEDPFADLPGAVALDPVATDLDGPIALDAPAGGGPRYVCERPGRIRLLESDGVAPEPALDITDAVVTGGERGLLGLALHPEFPSDPRAFLRYSAPPRSGTPEEYSHTFVLAEIQATADGRRFRTDTERTLLEIPEPQRNHNAGDLAFGHDGLLYVPVGDGGAGNDRGPGHVADWYDAVSGGNGQDVSENLLGSLLRIDVDQGDPYAVPEENPLVGQPGLDEHYAWGFRNPWRLSFDGEECYVADVGQSAYEEVNRLVAGGNYGWNVREGTHCFGADSCPDRTPADVRGGETLLDPVVEYPHGGEAVSGISIIGGHVYRGEDLDGFQGRYVFGDLQPGGRIFVAQPRDGELAANGAQWPTTVVETTGGSIRALYAIGRDADEELYALGIGSDGGVVWRLRSA